MEQKPQQTPAEPEKRGTVTEEISGEVKKEEELVQEVTGEAAPAAVPPGRMRAWNYWTS